MWVEGTVGGGYIQVYWWGGRGGQLVRKAGASVKTGPGFKNGNLVKSGHGMLSVSSDTGKQKSRRKKGDRTQTSALGSAGSCSRPAWAPGDSGWGRALEKFPTSLKVKDSLSLRVSTKADPELPPQFILKTES